MTDLDLVVRARRAVVGGAETACTVGVRDGRIEVIDDVGHDLAAQNELVLGDDRVLLPGLVDTHVHFNDPGRDDWEGFAHGTRAAAAGGVTTVVDMPLNSLPPTVDLPALQAKTAAARGRCFVDVGLWGGAVPERLPEMPSLHQAGVFGFKCFVLPSGVPEFAPLDQAQLAAAFGRAAEIGALMLVHAEDDATVAAATSAVAEAHPGPMRRYADFVSTRPPRAEALAVRRVAELAASTACRAHIVHVSSADALDVVEAARADGVRLTAETCPHYLALDADGVPDGDVLVKCCPPVRDRAHRDRLWRALADGVLDCVVSDHSPASPEVKGVGLGDFQRAWGGIAAVQLGLPVVWTQARRRGHSLAQVVEWMAAGPARLAGLTTKGSLAVGNQADFCVFAPDETFQAVASALHQRHPITPYDGRRLDGAVRETWLAGVRVDDRPRGRVLRRGQA